MHTIWECTMFHILNLLSSHTSHNQDQVSPKIYKCHSSIHSHLTCWPTTSLCLEQPTQMPSQICCSRILLDDCRGLISVAGALVLWSLKAHPFLPVKAAAHFNLNFADLVMATLFVGLFIDWHLINNERYYSFQFNSFNWIGILGLQ